jgi:hypothetical protein
LLVQPHAKRVADAGADLEKYGLGVDESRCRGGEGERGEELE